MKVRFKSGWFAPTALVAVDKMRSFSGMRFRKGVHEVPKELEEYLPSSAEVLKDNYREKIEEEVSKDFKDYDEERALSDEQIEAEKKAEVLRRVRQANAAAARAKRKAKQEAQA